MFPQFWSTSWATTSTYWTDLDHLNNSVTKWSYPSNFYSARSSGLCALTLYCLLVKKSSFIFLQFTLLTFWPLHILFVNIPQNHTVAGEIPFLKSTSSERGILILWVTICFRNYFNKYFLYLYNLPDFEFLLPIVICA